MMIVHTVVRARWALFWGLICGLASALPAFMYSVNPLAFGAISVALCVLIAFGRFIKAPGLQLKADNTPRIVPPSAGWAAIAVPFVAAFEGLVLITAPDPIGIPTYCYGETQNAHIGDVHTKPECDALLRTDLIVFHDKAMACLHVPASQSRQAAITSFAFNVGVSGFCHSTFVHRLNANDPHACDSLRAWEYAGGIRWPGLVRRREAERKLCNA